MRLKRIVVLALNRARWEHTFCVPLVVNFINLLDGPVGVAIDVKKEIQMSDDQKQKNEAIEKISSIKNLKKLKELADNFEKEEWEQLKTVEDFKNYLISKI